MKSELIVGVSGSGKTEYVKNLLAQVNGEYLLFDHQNEYTAFEKNRDIELDYFDIPTGVPDYIWFDVLAEIFCETFGLGQRAYMILTLVFERVFREEEEKRRKHLFNLLYEHIEIQLHIREAESNGKVPFAEQENYYVLKQYFNSWIGKPVEKLLQEPHSTNRLNLAHMSKREKAFLMKLCAAKSFYERLYNPAGATTPLFIVFEHAELLFPSEQKKDALLIHETLIESIIREGRNYNVYCLFVANSKRAIPAVIIDNVYKTEVIPISEKPLDPYTVNTIFAMKQNDVNKENYICNLSKWQTWGNPYVYYYFDTDEKKEHIQQIELEFQQFGYEVIKSFEGKSFFRIPVCDKEFLIFVDGLLKEKYKQIDFQTVSMAI